MTTEERTTSTSTSNFDSISTNSVPHGSLMEMESDTDHADTVALIVPAAAHGSRLDQWLTEALTALSTQNDDSPIGAISRSQIKRWIKNGQVLVDHVVARPASKLETAQQIHVRLPTVAAPTTLSPEAIPLDIVHEDNNLLIINKPAGLVVHPAPGHATGTLANAVLHHCPTLEGVGGERRPGIVHRLDKDTSGLIAVAKNDSTHRFLQKQFQERTVYKEYLALVDGTVSPQAGRIVAPTGRHPTERKRQAILPPDPVTGESRGREAITDYETISLYHGKSRDGMGHAKFTLLRVLLHTGRTHQIRVHMAWHKNPVVGDTMYGYRKPRLALKRQFLHAHRLRLRLPNIDTAYEFIAPLPLDLQRVLDGLDV